MRTSGPYTIAAGQAFTLQPPSAGIRYIDVAIANASPYACAVNLSTSGPAQWLQPWSVDVYPLAQGDIPTVTAQFSTDTSGLVTTGNVTATWYSSTDTVTGSYPATLNGPAIAAAVSGTVTNRPDTYELASGSYTIPTSAAGGFGIDLTNVPATTRSLLVLLKLSTFLGAFEPQVVVTGNTSGQTWGTQQLTTETNNLTAFEPLYIPYYGLVDPVGGIAISWPAVAGLAGQTLDYWVLGLPDADLLGSSEAVPVITSAAPNATPFPTKKVIGASLTGANNTGTAATTLFAAPPAGWRTVVDAITFTAGSGGATAYVDRQSQIANPGIQVYVPQATPMPPIAGPLFYTTEAIQCFASAAVGLIVRAVAHTEPF